SVIFEAGGKKIVFSGDLGSGYSRLTGLPDIPQKADALFIEATYADDRHSLNFKDYEVFRKDLIKSVSKGKTVWIPALAFNRTQKVLYEINLMQKEGLLSKDIPVYSVSPSANVMNALYQKEALEKSGGWFLPEVYNGGSVLPKGLRQQMVRGYDAQMILLSASGDMDYGMSEKLAPVMLAKKDVSVMIVNYVSPQSAAARLLSGEYKSKIKSKALVKKYDIFSDHPDFSGISRWLENQDKDAFIYIIHSSRQNSLNMKKLLEDAGRSNASVALERRKITI
ncbi:MAG: hypothetical protein LBQ47_01125, partial [Endomicrobium sp.]|nr:hypothetical protein [Endomicrobium sp.]